MLMLEIFVRALDIPPKPLPPLPVPSYRLSENPVLCYENRPNYKPSDPAFNSGQEGFAINSEGFRDYEYKKEKPDGTYRIIAIGDSTTAGSGIRYMAHTYPKQLEKLFMMVSDSEEFEVLNMGVAGYHTLQEAELLRVKGLEYEPDFVILGLCLNDFDLYSDGGVKKALAEINEGRTVVRSRRELTNLILRNSRLFFVLYHRMMSLIRETGAALDSEKEYRERYLKGRSPVEAGFRLFSELQEEHGFGGFVFILPELSRPFAEYGRYDDHKRIFDIAERVGGIEVIDLIEDFEEYNEDPSDIELNALHLNEKGNRLLARILYGKIYERLPERIARKLSAEPPEEQ